MKQKLTIGRVINVVVLLILTFICLYPFLNVIAYSLSGYNAVLTGSVTFYPKDLSFGAYKEILGKKQIWQAMSTTVFVTIAGTALSLALTVFAAYALSREDLPGRKMITGFILFTMYFGGGMIPTFLVVKQVGLYDSLGALFIPNAVNVFNFIVMRTFFKSMPVSLEEAARIDGASYMEVLLHIILPLSLPIISPEKYTLQLRLRSLLFGGELNSTANLEGAGSMVMSQSLKMATVAVSTIPILVVYPWLQKYFVKGVMVGSVKG